MNSISFLSMPEKFANFVRTQTPHFGDFRNGVVPPGVRRRIELEW
jgi:hypothetical protein